MLQNAKNWTVKGVPINNNELLNIQACSLNMFWYWGVVGGLGGLVGGVDSAGGGGGAPNLQWLAESTE